MSNVLLLNSNEDLAQIYIQLFSEVLEPGDRVLYVGYEENDLLLPIIARSKVSILAVDREIRTNKAYENVQYIQTDFADIRKTVGNVHFEWVIFSFVLHENPSSVHEKFADIARSISDHIMIIEPLPRQDAAGIEFERELSTLYAKKNQVKCYHSAEYWRKTFDCQSDTDQCIILKRVINHNEKIPLLIHGKQVLISLQDIVIFICKK